MRSYTEEQRAKLLEFYATPMSAKEAARRVGISADAAMGILKREGIARSLPPGARQITEEELQAAHELVESGISVRETARRLNLPNAQLNTKLRKRGTNIRTQSEAAAHRNKQLAFNQQVADAVAEQIVAAFKDEDIPFEEIAKRFGTARKNVRTVLLQAGIPQSEIRTRQRRQTGAKSTIEFRKGADLDLIAKEYLAGSNLAQLAKRHGIAYVTLSLRLSQMGIEIRDNRKWEFRQDAFSTLTSEGAYWLGFIEADGNLGKDRPTLTIRLQERDINVLEDFADWLELDRENIRRRVHREGFGECLLSVQSSQIYNDLISYGIVPRKSWNWSGGFDIPKELFGDFVRGWFDGDGVAAFNMGRPLNGSLSVVGFAGLRDSLAWLREELAPFFPDDSLKLRGRNGSPEYFATLEMTQKAAIAAFYELANGYPRLERKWAKLDIHYGQWQKFGNKNWKADPEVAEKIRALK